jgi:hemolysin activation/secretion protein
VVERHLPPTPEASAPRLVEVETPADSDDRPLGPTLTGIVLLGSDGPSVFAPGVQIVGFRPPRQAALIRTLNRLLGQPLSRKRIADAIATVTESYRAAERPFVSVTTPEQDLTGGVLQLHVVEFTAGRLAVRAPTQATAADVASGIRFASGEVINARSLRQDVAWLDRYPFRRTATVFSPGTALGSTDLTVTVTPARPWQAFAGVTTSDAPSSGEARLFVGAVVGDLLGRGSLVSVQATASDLDDPRYWSVAGRAVVPLGPRRELSLLVAQVRGRADVAPFASRADTTQVALYLRFALPPAWLGDAHLGLETGRQRIDTRFSGLPVFDNGATTFAAVARYSAAAPLRAGALSAEVALHVSPGGIGAANTAGRLFFGRPRAGSATYAYLAAEIAAELVLSRGITWRGRLIVQATAAPLPGIEQIALGGANYVRGYTLDDGGYDSAVVARNTLAPRGWRIAPYIFTDWGVGRDEAARRILAVGSVGGGIGHALGAGRLTAEAALPLLDGRAGRVWHPRLLARAEIVF